MTPKKPVRAWLDLRISDDKTGEGRGIARHREECLEVCERRGYTVIGETVENSVKATKGRRKGLMDLLEMIKNRQFDVLVVWAQDRLLRRNDDLELLIEACKISNVTIVTVGGDLDLATDAGRLVARILASVAAGEIERKSARVRSAFEQSLRNGTKFGGSPRRFGYKLSNVEIDEEVEAPVLRRMYEMWNAGATLGEIVRWATAEGSVTAKGRTWTTGSLRQVLANPANAGLRGTKPLLTDEEGRPVLNSAGDQRRAEWHDVIGPATWPGVVDEDTWKAAASRLKDPARKSGRPNVGRKWLSAGLFRCATCNSVMKTWTNNQQRSVACPSLGHARRKAEPVEAYVRDIILERLRREDAIGLVQRRSPDVDLAALHEERDAIRERLRNLARDEVLGRRSRDEVLAAREVVAERLQEIDRDLEDAGRNDVVTRFVMDPRDPREVWDAPETTLAMRQDLIDALAVVTVGSGKIGRPHKYTVDVPPVNVFITWRTTLVTPPRHS